MIYVYCGNFIFNCIKFVQLFIVEDIEMNDGTPEKPYYMSNELRELLYKPEN